MRVEHNVSQTSSGNSARLFCRDARFRMPICSDDGCFRWLHSIHYDDSFGFTGDSLGGGESGVNRSESQNGIHQGFTVNTLDSR